MNKIRERFGDRRVLLPVVHCIHEAQVRLAAEVAMENGADGVFLINQGGMRAHEVAHVAGKLREDVAFVGLNRLGNTIMAIVHVSRFNLDAVWADQYNVPGVPADRSWLFFGGVAFKYQPAVDDVGLAAFEAVRDGVDVVTTSGPATGSPPTVEKVAAMRAAIGDHALAVASGITPENVEPFLAHVDAFLVASGVEQSFGVFDPARVRALAQAVHGW